MSKFYCQAHFSSSFHHILGIHQATFYLAELFRQAMFYLAELFRQIALSNKERKMIIEIFSTNQQTNKPTYRNSVARV